MNGKDNPDKLVESIRDVLTEHQHTLGFVIMPASCTLECTHTKATSASQVGRAKVSAARDGVEAINMVRDRYHVWAWDR